MDDGMIPGRRPFPTEAIADTGQRPAVPTEFTADEHGGGLIPLREHLNHRRVITAEPYSEGETPEAVIMMDVEEDSVTVLDVVVQAAYMLPVVGNVMAIGDAARRSASLVRPMSVWG